MFAFVTMIIILDLCDFGNAWIVGNHRAVTACTLKILFGYNINRGVDIISTHHKRRIFRVCVHNFVNLLIFELMMETKIKSYNHLKNLMPHIDYTQKFISNSCIHSYIPQYLSLFEVWIKVICEICVQFSKQIRL